jgi:putative alpha-1,2-mannosidase
MTLIQPERVNDIVNTMLAIYQQQGKLPIWHLQGRETDCMVGYSAVPVIADAIPRRAFHGFDANLALEAMKASSTRDDYGMNYLEQSWDTSPPIKNVSPCQRPSNTPSMTGASPAWRQRS